MSIIHISKNFYKIIAVTGRKLAITSVCMSILPIHFFFSAFHIMYCAVDLVARWLGKLCSYATITKLLCENLSFNSFRTSEATSI